LWEEYCDQCREDRKPPYMYSQFCKLYSDYVDQHRLTMHISHKPGDKLMVDWAGARFTYYDADDDKEQVCYLFVATLPFSMLCYAEAFTSMKQESTTRVHASAVTEDFTAA
jgi:transposase